jgi:hypothetical protein
MMEEKEFAAVIRNLLRLVINGQIETQALRLALAQEGLVDANRMDMARMEVRMMLRPVIEKLESAEVTTVDDILKSFEGPVQ